MLFFYLSLIDDPQEKSKFESLYYKYERTVINWANHYTSDYYAAEEVAQTVWIGIAKNIAYIQTDNESMLLSYLIKSVKNASDNFFRDEQKNRQTLSLDELEEHLFAEDFNDPVEQEEGYQNIVRDIASMPELYRDILILHFIHGYSTTQIAAFLNRNLNTVKAQLTRGRKMLHKIMKGKITDDKA